MDFAALLAAERKRARKPRLESRCPAPLAWRTDRPQLCRQRHRVVQAPDVVFHIPAFVSEEEEAALLRAIDASPPEQWTNLSGRRLQNLGGLPRAEGMVPEAMPPWLLSLTNALAAGVFDANHCLLNEYEPGQGIEAHRDGPRFAPRAAILSLGSVAGFDFVDDKGELAASLMLPPRGLLIFEGSAYEKWLHRVPAVRQDVATTNLIRLDATAEVPAPSMPPPRTKRVSLTLRQVNVLLSPRAEVEQQPRWKERAELARWLDSGPEQRQCDTRDKCWPEQQPSLLRAQREEEVHSPES